MKKCECPRRKEKRNKLEKLISSFNKIQQQGYVPDTILMSERSWDELVKMIEEIEERRT